MKRIIKSFIIVFSFFIVSTFLLYSQENDYFELFHDGEKVGKISIEGFEEMRKAAGIKKEEWEAEKEGRVEVSLKDDPWEVTIGEKFVTEVTIVWKNKDGKEIKTIVLEQEFTIKKETMSSFRIFYRDIAEIGFPIAIIIIIIIILI